MGSNERVIAALGRTARKAEPYVVFLVRLSLGATFAATGYGKLTHLERTVEFFRGLGIPAPELQAVFIGGLELVGGVCIALGLLTRLVAVPLAATMVVAILTALLPEVTSPLELITLDESLYLLLFAWLAAAGAGSVSLDRWLLAKAQGSRLWPTLRRFADSPT